MEKQINLAQAAENSLTKFKELVESGHKGCTGKGCEFCFTEAVDVFREAVKQHIIRDYARVIDLRTRLADLEKFTERLLKMSKDDVKEMKE